MSRLIVATALLVCGLVVMQPACAEENVPADWWGQVQKNIAAGEYAVTWQDDTFLPGLDAAWQAPNRAHDLRTYFTETGPRVIRRTSNSPEWVWGVEFTGLGGSDAQLAVPPAADAITGHGNRVEYRRGDIVEWYVNADKGLEQGFTFNTNPADGDSLVVSLAVRGDLAAGMMPDGQTIEFLTPGGVGVIHYGQLKAYDANGTQLPATLHLLAEGQPAIQIAVDVSAAEFPVTIDPLTTSAAWTAERDQANASFGYSVSTAGDVNGDGYADIIVGALHYDNGQINEGGAFLYLGSASGLSASADWTTLGGQEGAFMGISVSTAGDVNADGYADVIVGAYGYDNLQVNAGRACVYHGSASGLSATPAWTAESNYADACFGNDVSTAGDVNGDGYSDVIIGAAYYGSEQQGMASVFHGSASGLSGTDAWSAEGQAGANFGYSVSTAGDVNADGYADVVVAAPRDDNSQPDEGRVFVYHGSASGLSATAARTLESDQDLAFFGWSVSTAGDVNGDGYADVIVGAPFFDNVEANEGRAFLYQGSASGVSATAAWTAESDLAGVLFGSSVSTAGDVNGDGYADVVIGAPKYDNDQVDEGAAFAYFGSASGLSDTPDWTVESDQTDAWFGSSILTAGDVNGDGYADVIVGAQQYSNDQEKEGRVYVFNGAASGLSTTPGWTAQTDQDCYFAAAVSAAGDVNGDGYADVIVGAPNYDNGQSLEGRAYVYHGSTSGLSTSAAWIVESDSVGANFGWSVSGAGDVNGDGYSDVIVGACQYSNSQANEGAGFVYHGSASGLSTSAAWMVESDHEGARFGWSVSRAGDVNGDGYADVIVGAQQYSNDQANEGAAYVYHGSSAGLSTTAGWASEGDQAAAWFGHSVSTAGDVNGDGYSDIIVGAYMFTNDQPVEGKAFVYLGSPSGVAESPDWTAEGNQDSATFGNSVSTAGDVNGDGYADVIVGAYQYTNNETDEGRAFVYHGSASGLSTTADWTAESDQSWAWFGSSVSTAGDVNGDGYSDVVVGARASSNGEAAEGRAFVYLGSSAGLSNSAAWAGESDLAYAGFGLSVSTAGDVNGDGYADVIIGADNYLEDASSRGKAFLYYGNGEAGPGLSLNPRQRRTDDSAPISYLGLSNNATEARVAAIGRTPFGRGKVKLEYEIKPLGAPFDELDTVKTAAWTDTGTAGIQLDEILSGLSIETFYRWRVRLLYNPVTTPYQMKSRWFSIPWNGSAEADFRTPLPPPDPPTTPGADAISGNSITWTWADMSTLETGFKVYVDPGTALPTTLQTITPPEQQSWQHNGLSLNTKYTFQVCATNSYGDSEKTPAYSAWTLASTPTAPTISNPGPHSLDVAIGSGDGNPAHTVYGIAVNPPVAGNAWVQTDGALGASPIYRTAAAWGTFTVTGLPDFTQFSVTVTARNGAGVSTSASPASAGATTDGTGPTGSVLINSGSIFTTSPSVTLTLPAEDTGTGLTDMRFSNDNATWSGWEPYSWSKNWTLSAGDGGKTVFVQYRDTVGNVSTVSDQITLDTTPPAISLIGEASVCTPFNQPYIDAGATASDNIDGNISARIQVTNPVNTSLLGTYTVSYDVTDSAGNHADTVVRTVDVAVIGFSFDSFVDGATIYLSSSAGPIPLVFTVTAPEGAQALTFEYGGEQATVEDAPYRFVGWLDLDSPEWGVHTVSITLVLADATEASMEFSFTLAPAPDDSDTDANGIPDSPFSLLNDGDIWLNLSYVLETGSERMTVVRRVGATTTDYVRTELLNPESPETVMSVSAPVAAIVDGDSGLVVISTALDLQTLLGDTADPMAGDAPQDYVLAEDGAYTVASVLVTPDGQNYQELSEVQLEATPLLVSLTMPAVDPATVAYGQKTEILSDSAGLYVSPLGEGWTTETFGAAGVVDGQLQLQITSPSVFAPFVANPAEGEGEDEPGPSCFGGGKRTTQARADLASMAMAAACLMFMRGRRE